MSFVPEYVTTQEQLDILKQNAKNFETEALQLEVHVEALGTLDDQQSINELETRSIELKRALARRNAFLAAIKNLPVLAAEPSAE